MNGISAVGRRGTGDAVSSAHGVTATEAAGRVDGGRQRRAASRDRAAGRRGRRATRRVGEALEDLDLAHRRGLEPKTLNFANVATTAIEWWSGAKVVAHARSRGRAQQRTLTPPIEPDELRAGFARRSRRRRRRAAARRRAGRELRSVERLFDRRLVRRRLRRSDSRSPRDDDRRRRTRRNRSAPRTSPRGSASRRPASRCRWRGSRARCTNAGARAESHSRRPRTTSSSSSW